VRLPRPARDFGSRDEVVRWLRNQLFVEPGSAKDRVLARELEGRLVERPSGAAGLSTRAPAATGIVSWEPR
jgi:hypothetical protein